MASNLVDYNHKVCFQLSHFVKEHIMPNKESSQRKSQDPNIYRNEWIPEKVKGTVVIVHGIGEHIGRYATVAAALNQAGYAVFAAVEWINRRPRIGNEISEMHQHIPQSGSDHTAEDEDIGHIEHWLKLEPLCPAAAINVPDADYKRNGQHQAITMNAKRTDFEKRSVHIILLKRNIVFPINLHSRRIKFQCHPCRTNADHGTDYGVG